MKLIKKLSEMIEEEIEDAEKYARCALAHKEDNRELADVFFSLSGEELHHMEMLHEQVVRLIDAYRRENGTPPAAMQAVYDYLHQKHIDDVTNIAVMRDQYRRQ